MSKAGKRRKKPTAPGPRGNRTVSAAPVPKNNPWILAALVAAITAATFFAYWDVRTHDFLGLDDPEYASQNFMVRSGLTPGGVAWAFTTMNAANWHPLTWLSLMADEQMFGNKPGMLLLMNTFLHALNAALLFLLLVYLTRRPWRAAMAAALFALHPLHVESVAWIAERKDVLSAFFWFLTMLAYVWYVRRASWPRYLAVVACFGLGLLSKPMLVTLPFALLLLDFWPLRRTGPAARGGRWGAWRGLCIEKLPLIAMALASSMVTLHAQRASGAVVELGALPVPYRVLNAALSYARYGLKMFWPHPLSASYSLEKFSLSSPGVWAAVLALSAISALCWMRRSKNPYCLAGWLWFLGTLVPVIGIVQVGPQSMAERYTYVPLVGLFIAVVWLVADAAARLKVRVAALCAASLVALAALTAATKTQVGYWKDTLTLFSRAVEVDPRGEFPNRTLAFAYMRKGDLDGAQRYVGQALRYNAENYHLLALSVFCYLQKGNIAAARPLLDKAASLAPKSKEVLQELGHMCLSTGAPAKAVGYFDEAARIDPLNPFSHNNLGIALFQSGDFAGARAQFGEALRLDNTFGDAQRNLAAAQAALAGAGKRADK